MPAVNCPIPGCNFSTADTEPVLAAAQLNLHALAHTHATATADPERLSKQKPPKI